MAHFSGVLARLLLMLITAASLAACGAPNSGDASFERISAAAYVPSGAPKLTLITVVNNNTGAGGHSALLVSGTQQVIFDPAGSFIHEDIPRRGDVLYGMSPAWVQGYKSAHARSTYHVVTQEITVSPEVAAQALKMVRENGAVASAFCANATSGILRQLPGFEDIETTFFPVNLQEQFDNRPGVRTDRYYENDEGGVVDGIVAAQL